MNSWKERGLDAAYNIFDYTQNLVEPSVKLGVTGLSRSGKTVFITSLIYHLLHRQGLKFFEPHTSGRILNVYLEPHPDDLLPRFDYEGNLEKLTNPDPIWPEGTRHISQLRLTIVYQCNQLLNQFLGPAKLHIDLIDYPGEWLLDLPLLDMDYESWSKSVFEFANEPHAKPHAANWLEATEQLCNNNLHSKETASADNPPATKLAHATVSPSTEGNAKLLADHFTAFLTTTRQNAPDLPTIPPGRFLMPGDLKGSPALTFAPMNLPQTNNTTSSELITLKNLMQRRYEAYKELIIRPFYRKFFTRLDRQIILVDVLSNLSAGQNHLNQLQSTLCNILRSFNPGQKHWLSSIWNKKIDRLVFAATKADHLHHHSHDQLQKILSTMVASAINEAELKGADVKVQALSSLRTTKEVTVEQNGETFEALTGTPEKGTTFQGKTFDGQTEVVLFPGELESEIESELENELVSGRNKQPDNATSLEIINFAPPRQSDPSSPRMPHIRLDRALNMLIGDKLT